MAAMMDASEQQRDSYQFVTGTEVYVRVYALYGLSAAAPFAILR